MNVQIIQTAMEQGFVVELPIGDFCLNNGILSKIEYIENKLFCNAKSYMDKLSINITPSDMSYNDFRFQCELLSEEYIRSLIAQIGEISYVQDT